MRLFFTSKNTAVVSGTFSFTGFSIEPANWLPNFFMVKRDFNPVIGGMLISNGNNPRQNRYDLTGGVFERLTVIGFSHIGNVKQKIWNCMCICGNKCTADTTQLVQGRKRSCGCLITENGKRQCAKRITHGDTVSGKYAAEYGIWAAMLRRCYNKNTQDYKDYGAKGINVCDRWRHSYKNFIDDMGRRPSNKHSIDRYPNKTGNYEPSNCRWATMKQQARNTSTNRMLTYNGETKCLIEWAEVLDVHRGAIGRRVKKFGDNMDLIVADLNKTYIPQPNKRKKTSASIPQN